LRDELVNLGKEWRATSPILRLEIYIANLAAQRGRGLIDRLARIVLSSKLEPVLRRMDWNESLNAGC